MRLVLDGRAVERRLKSSKNRPDRVPVSARTNGPAVLDLGGVYGWLESEDLGLLGPIGGQVQPQDVVSAPFRSEGAVQNGALGVG